MRHIVCLAALTGWMATLGVSPANAGPDGGPSPGTPVMARVPDPSGPSRPAGPSGPSDPAERRGGSTGLVLGRAVVLSINQGATISPTTRVVVLQCTPIRGGTHPKSQNACAALIRVNGDVGKIKPSTKAFCPLIYDPVTISAGGIWDGRFYVSSQTFSNNCLLRSSLGDIAVF
ncbi:SSI family serine proteinase inhibitor [Streptosporangium sp. NPDC050855]|uniref:SSI family serine proteinase inhibitor n=1 Tax=Streptosporangium sp. NPDC050855 TaxID=3366194 RepID=UPI0037A2FC88